MGSEGRVRRSEGAMGVRDSEGMLYCFKVPTTSVGQGVRGVRG